MITGRILSPMSDFSGTRRLRETEYNRRLQATAVVSVITGVVLLAVSAFLLSYARIHQIAVTSGVSPALAGLYPLIVDTTLVVACVATVAMRGAVWWMRGYAALSIVILLAVVAVVEALQAAGINLPRRYTAATLAAMPWALFLLGFGLWLSTLRHQRTVRAVARPGDQGNGKESVGRARPREPAVGQRSAGLWNADPDTPDASLIPAEPKPASPSPDPGTPDVSLMPAEPKPASPSPDPRTPDVRPTPGPGNEHHHRHGHGHGHGNVDDGGD